MTENPTTKALYEMLASDNQKLARGWYNSAAHSMAIAQAGEPVYFTAVMVCQKEAAEASARAMKYLFLAMECG